MFSPALGPAGFPMAMPPGPFMALQTPMNASFAPPLPPLAPGRPGPQHRTHQSIALSGLPYTPLGGQFPPLGMPLPLGNGPVPGFVPRSRRTMSVGGPPKAVLGGPKPKEAVVPAAAAAVIAAPAPAPAVPDAPPVKGKKTTVKVPKETVEQDGVQSRPPWARNPLVQAVDEQPSNWLGLEIDSGAEPAPEAGPSRVIMKNKVWASLPATAYTLSNENTAVVGHVQAT
jgi:hypothetical protein